MDQTTSMPQQTFTGYPISPCVTPECVRALNLPPLAGDTYAGAAPVPSTSNIGAFQGMAGGQTLAQGGMVPQSSAMQQSSTPITPMNQPMPLTVENLMYLNGYLRTQIGRKVTVEFLVGTSTIVDRTGILLEVGANYILINETETDDILACDFYNIKFVRFLSLIHI